MDTERDINRTFYKGVQFLKAIHLEGRLFLQDILRKKEDSVNKTLYHKGKLLEDL